MPNGTVDPYATVRRMLLALLVFGLVGTATELALLEHYEELTQFIPFFAIAAAIGCTAAQAVTTSARTTRVFQGVMVLLIAAGMAGVVLHYLGSLEFQRDMDPGASQWELFKKVIRAKAPPTLAPGTLAQLGLLGLISTYRHPATNRTDLRTVRTQGASS